MTDKAEDVKALIAQIAEPRARTDIAEALAEAIDESEIDYTEMSRFVVAQAAEIAALKRRLDFFSDLPTLKRENERQAAEIAALRAEIERLKLYEDWTPDEHKRVVAQLADKDAEIERLREPIISKDSVVALTEGELCWSVYQQAVAWINAQASEIAALKNDLDRLTRGTWSLEIARRSLMTADLRAELAAAKEALRQTTRAQAAEIAALRDRIAELEVTLGSCCQDSKATIARRD